MALLEKTFTKIDYSYSVINGEKIYAYNTCCEQILRQDGSRKTWIITRSVQPNRIGHYIECTVKSKTDVALGFTGRTSAKIYDTDKAFEKAILRIESIVKKSK